MNEIWAIILAAGESRRMDTPKMLLPFKGKTIIEKVIENVISSDVNKTLVVVGSSGDIILERIKDLPVSHCYNENYREGMLSSVRCGFSNLPEKFEAVIVMPGDYPGIGVDVINILIDSFRRSEKKIIIPLFGGKRGHPILICYDFRNEVMKLDPEDGLRELAMRFPDEVLEVEVDDPTILRDIDTMDDYISELKQKT
jgi:molybdenum cofactor cytidylyltransferase